MPSARPLVALALLLASSPALAQSPISFADPVAPRIAIGRLESDLVTDADTRPTGRTHDAYADITLGADVTLFRATFHDTRLALGVQPTLRTRFRLRPPDFDQVGDEWYAGFPVSLTRAGATVTLRPWHRSAHMGDDMFTYDRHTAREATENRFETRWTQEWRYGVTTVAAFERPWLYASGPLADPAVRSRVGLEYRHQIVGPFAFNAGVERYGRPGYVRLAGAAGIRAPWFGRDCAILVRRVSGPSLVGQFGDRQERWFSIEAAAFGFARQR